MANTKMRRLKVNFKYASILLLNLNVVNFEEIFKIIIMIPAKNLLLFSETTCLCTYAAKVARDDDFFFPPIYTTFAFKNASRGKYAYKSNINSPSGRLRGS